MSSKPDVDALADALRTDPEAREKVVDAIVEEMNVDGETTEGAAAQSYRRDVLKALGLAGTAAVAGGAAQHALTEPAAAAHGNGEIGVAGDPLDTLHVTSIDGDGENVGVSPGLGAVDIETLNSTVVNVAKHDTFQAAVDAAPVGGVLYFPPEDFDTTNYGTATVDKPLHFAGYTGLDSSRNVVGTNIIQNAASAVFTIDSTIRHDGMRMNGLGATFQTDNPLLLNNGAKAIRTDIRNLILQANDTATRCLDLRSESFYLNLFNCHVIDGVGEGLFVNTSGGQIAVRSCSAIMGGSQDGTLPAAEIGGNNRIYIENSDFGGNGSDGLYLTRVGTGGDYSATIIGLSSENGGVGVTFGPASETDASVRNVTMYGGHITGNDGPSIKFDDAVNACAFAPQINDGATSGTAIEWTTNASVSGAVLHRSSFSQSTFNTGNGEFAPYVMPMPGTHISNTVRGNVDAMEGMHFYNSDDGNLNIFDGTDWILPDGTVT